MSKNLGEKMDALRGIANGLNALAESATKTVQAVEQFLSEEIHLGVSGETEPFHTETTETEEDRTEQRIISTLAYGRLGLGGKYRIHVVSRVQMEAGPSLGPSEHAWMTTDTERKAWPNCTRDIKLKAFSRLPELLDTLIDKGNQMAIVHAATTADIRAAISIADPAVDVERNGPPIAGRVKRRD